MASETDRVRAKSRWMSLGGPRTMLHDAPRKKGWRLEKRTKHVVFVPLRLPYRGLFFSIQ